MELNKKLEIKAERAVAREMQSMADAEAAASQSLIDEADKTQAEIDAFNAQNLAPDAIVLPDAPVEVAAAAVDSADVAAPVVEEPIATADPVAPVVEEVPVEPAPVVEEVAPVVEEVAPEAKVTVEPVFPTPFDANAPAASTEFIPAATDAFKPVPTEPFVPAPVEADNAGTSFPNETAPTETPTP
jgi:hypothetical protein